MKKLLLLIITLLSISLIGCTETSSVNEAKRNATTDTKTTTISDTEITTTSDVVVYDLLKIIDEFKIKEDYIKETQQEDLIYYICFKETGDIKYYIRITNTFGLYNNDDIGKYYSTYALDFKSNDLNISNIKVLELFTLEINKEKIILEFKRKNDRLVHKEFNTNEYYLDIVNKYTGDKYPYIKDIDKYLEELNKR